MSNLKSTYVSTSEAINQQVATLQETGSPITDLAVGSVARSLLEANATVWSSQSQVADQLKLDSYLETAEGEALDVLAKGNWFVNRLPSVKATGKITITRQETSSALLLPAAWSQLTMPPAAPGAEGVAVLTTEDASFAEGTSTATVGAVAVAGGPEGNLGLGTKLTPTTAVLGVSSQEGFVVSSAFSGGVAEETDAAYRARVPLVVQGRQAKGSRVAFLAAAISVPGVLSAGVLGAGGLRGNETQVSGGHVEVYYQGAAGLLAQVGAAVEGAAVVNQEVASFASVSLEAPRGQKRVVLEGTLVCEPGINPETLAKEAAEAASKYVEGRGIGGTAYLSELVEAIHQLGTVVSVSLPLTKFALYGNTGATNLTVAGDSYLDLAVVDCHFTVTEL